jgi:hypothetical protein
MPVVEPTVAIVESLPVHAPPVVVEASVIVDPDGTLELPVIAVGTGFTTRLAVAKQPVLSMYEITVVPADTPFATPVEEPIVATDVTPLLQAPPVGELLRLVEPPAQTTRELPIDDGVGFTVTTTLVALPEVM